MKRSVQKTKYGGNIPVDLYEYIMRGVSRAQKRRNAYYAAFFTTVGVGSFLGSVILARAAIRALFRSGFFSYASLLWSDTEMMVQYGKDFLFSIGESFPVVDVIAFLGALFIFVWSMRALGKIQIRQWSFKTHRI